MCELPKTGKFIDLTGQTFHFLKVISYCGKEGKRHMWLCECIFQNCGVIKRIHSGNFKKKEGGIKSCGCYRKYRVGNDRATHRMTKTAEYHIWQGMLNRCRKEDDKDYPRYGGRGITVCESWKKFENFLQDMGMRPSKDLSIDRKDVDGNYCPENCKWSTTIEQQNNKRNNHLLTYKEKTQTITQWARELGIKVCTLKTRIRDGWTIERALTEKVRISNEKRTSD